MGVTVNGFFETQVFVSRLFVAVCKAKGKVTIRSDMECVGNGVMVGIASVPQTCFTTRLRGPPAEFFAY